jgi:hypothetical protein
MHDGRRKHTLAVSMGAITGGLLGTAAIQKAMGLSQKLPEPLHMPKMKRDPGDIVVSRAEEVRGGPLPPKVHAGAVRATHWLYGLAWAGALAALAPRLKMHRAGNALLAGAALGAIAWGSAFIGWLPATGLTQSVARERASKSAMSLATHVLCGVVTAVPIFAAERLFRRHRFARWF